MTQQTVTGGAVNHGGGGAELFHLSHRCTALAGVAQRQEPGPLEPLRRCGALAADITVV